MTADGKHIVANREENHDLYWALSGGGGGTYGIVLSMTSKVYPDTPTAGANLTFLSTGLSRTQRANELGVRHWRTATPLASGRSQPLLGAS